MDGILLIVVLAGAVCAAITAGVALRAGLRLWRARAGLQERILEEVSHLAGRAGELEERANALSVRAGELPVGISRLQQDLATLQVLTRTLSVSLRQAQRLLSYTRLRTSGSAYVAELAQDRLTRAAGKLRR